MGTNRDIKSDGAINITSTQTNISGDLDVTGSINNFTFPGSDGITGQALVTNGSGTLSFADSGTGGGSGVNHIANPRATANNNGYVIYADAAGTSPVDGTGGTGNISFNRNTTTPLRDQGDFKLEKDAVNRQGQGVSYDFTVDLADKARMMVISFDYDASHASYADADLKIFIYDVTNTQLIRVRDEEIKQGTGKHYAQFQTASNSVSYRLIFHVSSTNASAYNVFFDEISVGPQNISHGVMVTDWVEYTPTFNGNNFDNVSFRYRRNGDSVEVQGYAQANGAPASNNAAFTLPSGLNIDASKAGTSRKNILGFGARLDDGGGYSDPPSIFGSYNALSTQMVYVSMADQSTAQMQQVGWDTILTGDNDAFTINVTAPITGWSSNAQMSQLFTGRDVVMQTEGSKGSQSFANNAVADIVDWNNASIDTTGGSFDGTAYTAPEDGYYDIQGQVGLSNDADSDFLRTNIYMLVDKQDGSGYVDAKFWRTDEKNSGAEASQPFDVMGYYLKRGDKLKFQFFQANSDADAHTMRTTAGHTWLYISKRNSAQSILQDHISVVVDAAVTSQNIASASATKVTLNDTVDNTSSFDDTNNRFTAPVPGFYKVTVIGQFNNLDASGTDLKIYKNGASSLVQSSHASLGDELVIMNRIMELSKGDYIEIYVDSASDSNYDIVNMELTITKG